MRHVGGSETLRYVVVDGNNVLQRAYYAFVESRLKEGLPLHSGPDGYPTGLIYGFLSFLSSWLYEIKNYSAVAVFFDGSPSRRRALDPSYKIKREDTKSNLRIDADQGIPIKLRDGFEFQNDIAVLNHILQLLGCEVYFHPQEEADDLIATFCKQKTGSVRIIVSDDKDFFQLLTDPRVVIFRPSSRDNRFIDAQASEQIWGKLLKGKHPKVPCGQVRMFKTLCGDASDSIVGVHLLRKKTAMTVCHLPTVEDVISSGMPQFSSSERLKTLEAQDRLRINWQLIGLKDDIDLASCLHKAEKNYPLALDICREDLSIGGLDLGPFRPSSVSQQQSIPMEEWLTGI